MFNADAVLNFLFRCTPFEILFALYGMPVECISDLVLVLGEEA